MRTAGNDASDETHIRALIDRRIGAVRAKDVNAALSDIAPDIISFDVVNPLQYVGSDALRKRVEEWFASFQGAIGLEVANLSIAASNDVAFSYSLNRVSGTTMDGGDIDMWLRATVCYRKIDGQWMVAHEHNSVPFDPASGKASLDLEP